MSELQESRSIHSGPYSMNFMSLDRVDDNSNPVGNYSQGRCGQLIPQLAQRLQSSRSHARVSDMLEYTSCIVQPSRSRESKYSLEGFPIIEHNWNSFVCISISLPFRHTSKSTIMFLYQKQCRSVHLYFVYKGDLSCRRPPFCNSIIVNLNFFSYLFAHISISHPSR